MPRNCTIQVEDVFGPRVQDCGTDFDFTLLFEESILFILPLCVVLLLAVGRCAQLLGRPTLIRNSPLYVLKIIVFISLVLAQVAQLAALLGSHGPRTRTTLPAIILGIAGYIFLTLLAALEHRRSLRPSSILLFYLFVTLSMNIVRCRTLFSIERNDAQASSFSVFSGLALFAFCVELVRKPLLPSIALTEPSHEERSSIVARSFMWWITPLFAKGFRGAIVTEGLPTIDHALVTDRFELAREKAAGSGGAAERPKRSLLSELFNTHRRVLLEPIIPRLCLMGLTFAQPFLVEAATEYTSTDYGANNYKVGGGLIAAYFLVYFGIAVVNSIYQQKINRLATVVRAGLVSQICEQSLRVELATATKTASPTLVSAHVESIQHGFRYFHEIWANLATAGIALWLLYQQLHAAMFATLGLILTCIITSFVLSTIAGPYQRKWFDKVENRVLKTSQIINLIKSVKTIGAESQVRSLLSTSRLIDIHSSQRFRAFITIIVTLSYTSQALGPALGLGIHTVIVNAGPNQLLTAPTAFSSLTLFSLASAGLALAINSILGFLSMLSCLSRIDDFIHGHARHDPRQISPSSEALSSEISPSSSSATILKYPSASPSASEKSPIIASSPQPSISLSDVSASHSASSSPILTSITFEANPSELLLVTGPTGSGKSTLLKAILGELENTTGKIHVRGTEIGYCDQKPWVFKGTLRENIVGFDGEFDGGRYTLTLKLCGLDRDLRDWVDGDETVVGSSGFGLSGGQKARVALARAVYAQPPILILDDTFAGLDADTSRKIADALWGEERTFVDWRPTTVWATSTPKFWSYADRVVLLGNGTIAAQGSPDTLVAEGLLDASTALNSEKGLTQVETAGQDPVKEAVEKEAVDEATVPLPASDWRVYQYYFDILGWWNFGIFVLLMSLFVLGIIYPQIYVDDWTNYSATKQHNTLATFLGVYFGAGFGGLVAFASACTYFIIQMGPRASFQMHQSMLSIVLNAPMSFFYNTSSGVTINRFSQDLQIIDRELMFSLIQTMLQILSLIGQFAVVIIGSKYTGIAIPGIIIVLFFVQLIYLRTSRQLRILDIEARAPLVSLFLESLEGLATIRAMGWVGRYQVRGREATAFSQKPFYLLYAGQILLEFVLDSINAILAIIIISLAVGLKSSTRSSGLGLALFNIVSFSQSIKTLIQQWTTLEISLGAVARVRDFTMTTTVEPDEGVLPAAEWPPKGEVEFSNISVSYSDTQPDVISDLSLRIPAGTRVALCGRSGSGKSTLVSSLLRLVPVRSGSISIDGTSITELSRSGLRANLNALPQEGFAFCASVRENLSCVEPVPGDEEMVAALQRVGLWERIKEKGGLEAEVNEELLSHGLVQLFCFARLLLKRGKKVMVLDEYSSSVDEEIEDAMLRILKEDFAGCTLVVVAHRLDGIIDFDTVVVMQSGKIVEMGNPKELLEREETAFARLYADYKGKKKTEDDGDDDNDRIELVTAQVK